jgi:hypothetical protein
MIPPIDQLFVIWRASAARDGTRHVVGMLRREANGYVFSYGADLRAAEADGFRSFPEFPRDRGPFVSRYLFPTFQQRVPSPSRPDFQQMLDTWGVTRPDDVLEILARSGGLQATDRIELAEYRAEDDDLSRPLSFRVAGPGHYDDPDATGVPVGALVELVREPANRKDAHASLVVSVDGRRLGHVPRQYSKMFARLLDGGTPLLACTDRRLSVPGEGARWVIRAERRHGPTPATEASRRVAP